ncbi:HD domain-containing protein [Psychroflexus sp. MES1-P1E]|uniref:HD domain-containing protein n=1 Tax=Psychroflexus sp. MES1-P1E TaxID=2058320 RepID=UPI000C7E0678|nr:hypothetical protein [Psychroflexus sp. MES1-P1E]PKG43638.1 hypothetical protein CXF67_03930 [Psychroflexus sp. MES1-P1E]
MSWVDTTYEIAMKALFRSKLKETKGNQLFGEYESIRNSLVKDNFFAEIKAKEPDLSDHSQKHIQDVLERAYKVIGDKEFKNFTPHEIYCLAMMILFHDVGNIFGRNGHASIEKISEVYNRYRANHSNYRNEKRVIALGASAHSGKARDGSKDTLRFIKEGNIEGNKVNLLELSAILRFADELAEGKQRTCSFLLDTKRYKKGSLIYQKYAKITTIDIDRAGERINISYEINVSKKFNKKEQEEIAELLRFTYYRASKLDIERRYTKHYSEIVKKFKSVSVAYFFSVDEIPIDLNLKSIVFEDKYPMPDLEFNDDATVALYNSIKEDCNDYDTDNLINLIKSKT